MDLEITSEFIVVAATLIEIKSKNLLPKVKVEEEENAPVIARRKTFTLTPMDEQEALEQLILLGHEDFFVFYNAQTSKINILYRRRDGTYGLIDPVVG